MHYLWSSSSGIAGFSINLKNKQNQYSAWQFIVLLKFNWFNFCTKYEIFQELAFWKHILPTKQNRSEHKITTGHFVLNSNIFNIFIHDNTECRQ